MNHKFKLSASLICANSLEFGKEIERLNKGKADYIHFDVMDGNFVPRYGLYPELISSIKRVSKIPVVVHMMTEEPSRYIQQYVLAGADIILVHPEACTHLHYTLKTIRDAGIKAGVSLNIATPLNVLDYVIEDIDYIELMAINPGIVGHKVISQIFRKIRDLKKFLKLKKRKNILIEIDGGVNEDTAAKMVVAGADVLVCGSSSIFKSDMTVDKKIVEFRSNLTKKIKRNGKV
jgi:ribulose-phosphate 3-epimerase